MLFYLLPTLLCAAHHLEAATVQFPVSVKSQRLFQVVRQEQSEELQFLNDQKANGYFFMTDMSSRSQHVQDVFRDFQRAYAERRTITIDLDNLSGRDRILLMHNIMAEKRSNPLPKVSESSEYWRIDRQGFYSFFVDLYPTQYNFGQKTYQIEGRPTSQQPGNGLLTILSSENGRTYYDNLQVYLRLMEISKTFPRLSQSMKKARKSGIAMTVEQGFAKQEDADFCNYVIILEDFSIARHFICPSIGERESQNLYADLPVSVGVSRLQRLDEKGRGRFSYGQHFDNTNPYHFYSESKERRVTAIKKLSAQVVSPFFMTVDLTDQLETGQRIIHTAEGVHQELIDAYENDGYESSTVYEEPLIAVPLTVEEREVQPSGILSTSGEQTQGVHQRASKKHNKGFEAARGTGWRGSADTEPLVTAGSGHTKEARRNN